MNRVINYFKEVREELEKVVWPTKEQTIRYTILVLIVATSVGIALGALDYVLTILTAELLSGQ